MEFKCIISIGGISWNNKKAVPFLGAKESGKRVRRKGRTMAWARGGKGVCDRMGGRGEGFGEGLRGWRAIRFKSDYGRRGTSGGSDN